MTNRFMMSVAAAALIAGTGFANAQGTGTSREAPSAGSTGSRARRAARAVGRARCSDEPRQRGRTARSGEGMKATKSDQACADEGHAVRAKMQPAGAKNQRAQDDMKAGPKGEKSAQDNNMKGEKSKSMSSETIKRAQPPRT